MQGRCPWPIARGPHPGRKPYKGIAPRLPPQWKRLKAFHSLAWAWQALGKDVTAAQARLKALLWMHPGTVNTRASPLAYRGGHPTWGCQPQAKQCKGFALGLSRAGFLGSGFPKRAENPPGNVIPSPLPYHWKRRKAFYSLAWAWQAQGKAPARPTARLKALLWMHLGTGNTRALPLA